MHAISISLAFDVLSFQIFLILSIRFSRCNPDSYPSRRFPLRSGSGNHLFSRIVSNTVPSADMVFTVVFGMGTGVTPYRIATGNIWLFNNVRAGNFTVLQPSRSATCFARRLVPGRVPYTNLLPSQSLHASMQACSFKRLLQEL